MLLVEPSGNPEPSSRDVAILAGATETVLVEPKFFNAAERFGSFDWPAKVKDRGPTTPVSGILEVFCSLFEVKEEVMFLLDSELAGALPLLSVTVLFVWLIGISRASARSESPSFASTLGFSAVEDKHARS